MKKVLILIDNVGPKKELFRKLIAERLGTDAEVTLQKFSDVRIEIGEKEVNAYAGEVDLKRIDLVYFRRIDHSIFPLSHSLALFFDKYGVKYFDTTFKEVGAGGDKVTSLTRLALSGIPVPKSMFMTRDNILGKEDEIIKSLGLPIIAKDTKAQGNTGIFVIRSKEDFKLLLDSKKVRPTGSPSQFLFQKFMDIDKEFRLLVLGDKVAVVHTKAKRKYDELVIGWKDMNEFPEFINPGTVPAELKAMAVKAAKALNIEIAGVDGCLLKGGDSPVILEVNRGPGLEYDTAKSPEIDQIADFFKNELAKNA